MKRSFQTALLGLVTLLGAIALVHASMPTGKVKPDTNGNAYYVYTSALPSDESGVVKIPPRFKWSIETSWRGIDVQGKNLPDTRVMLRLYDPEKNFTAITAQMDLDTAAQLHRQLGAVIAKKRQDPDYQFRPELYQSKAVPTKSIKSVDSNGVAIVEDVPAPAQVTPSPTR